MPDADPKDFKEKIQTLLGIATRLGLVEEYNNHYFARSHAEDILPMLNSKTQSRTNDAHSEAVQCTCLRNYAGNSAIASDESWVSIASSISRRSSGHPATSHGSLASHLSSEEELKDIKSSQPLFIDDGNCASTSRGEQQGSNLSTQQKKSKNVQ
ncbi:hypothetical protein AWZ03_009602 [Drosophila navojoa]|uniref:Uncharacterized protein n=1 Tax=Drosophila navojoa TaxID=7232 RepID=A0A484B527_DRONA|nr:hypothetical protein AWZ03_009602 [Drosophila navojoa]